MSTPTIILWAPTLDVLRADQLFPTDDQGVEVLLNEINSMIFTSSADHVERFTGLRPEEGAGQWRTSQQMGMHDFDQALDAMAKCLIGAVEFSFPHATLRVMWTCDI